MRKKIQIMLLLSLLVMVPLAESAEKLPYDVPYPTDCHLVRLEIYVKQLGNTIKCFQTVLFDKLNLEFFVRAFDKEGAGWAKDVLDLGTGTGALGITALAYGAQKVVATDLDPLAIENARFNAKRLGFTDRFDARQVKLENPGVYSVIDKEERFDLIICDPPQGTLSHPSAKKVAKVPIVMKEEFFGTDEKFVFLASFMEGLNDHIKENGRAWICIRYPETKKKMAELADKYGFTAKILISWNRDVDPKKEIPVGDNYRVPPPVEDIILYELTRKK